MCGISLSTFSSVLSPNTWPFSLKWLPQPAYLVGGIVRDALLGRQSDHLDLDFVMPEGAVETAQAIARHHKAGFVLLDAERQIARVVFDQATADFAQQMGPSLEIDLQRRDFTVNAIAYNPHTDELIDPLRGYTDLQRNSIRMISRENLQEDPLRLLRAYRQAAQLNFTLESDTQSVIRQLAACLEQVAAERVQAELSYLFGSSKGTLWLIAAWQDQLLKGWFPHATAAGITALANLDQSAAILAETWPAFGQELSRSIREAAKSTKKTGNSQGAGSKLSAQACNPQLCSLLEAEAKTGRRTWLTVAKLTTLLPFDLTQAEVELQHLKYSRVEIQAAVTILKFLPQVQSASDLEAMSRREQYYLFQGVGSAFPALGLRAVASGIGISTIAPLIERFLDPNDPVAHPKPLLSGQDLMTALKIPSGPQIGQLLAAIQLARAEGKISTTADALELAASIVRCQDRLE